MSELLQAVSKRGPNPPNFGSMNKSEHRTTQFSRVYGRTTRPGIDSSSESDEEDEDDDDNDALSEGASRLNGRNGRNRTVFGNKRNDDIRGRTEILNAIDAARQENIEHETSE